MSGAKSFALVYELTGSVPASTVWSLFSLKTASGSLFTEVLLCNLAGYDSISSYWDFQSAVNSIALNPTLDTGPHALIMTYAGGGNETLGNFAATLDGVAKALANPGSTPAGRTATDLASLGGRLTSADVVATGANVAIGEFVVSPVAWGATDIANLNAYFQQGWGV